MCSNRDVLIFLKFEFLKIRASAFRCPKSNQCDLSASCWLTDICGQSESLIFPRALVTEILVNLLMYYFLGVFLR